MGIFHKLRRIIEKPWWSFAGFALAFFLFFGLTGRDIWGLIVNFEWIIDATKWSLIVGAFIFGVSAHSKANRLSATEDKASPQQAKFPMPDFTKKIEEMMSSISDMEKRLEGRDELPNVGWFSGKDAMKRCKIGHNDLIQMVLHDGLRVYPKDTDIYFIDDETPPMENHDFQFLLSVPEGSLEEEVGGLWFKREDLEGVKRHRA